MKDTKLTKEYKEETKTSPFKHGCGISYHPNYVEWLEGKVNSLKSKENEEMPDISIIQLRKDTPRRVADNMLDNLYKSIDGDKASSVIDFKEQLQYDIQREKDMFSIKIMGNI